MGNDVYLKVFADSKCRLVAICDIDLIGETFREGKLKLDVKPGFYKGSASNISEALHEIAAADIANLVGSGIVDAAVREGLVDPTAIVRIAGVPHVQIVKL
ncbi:MAG TPA: DUF424 family protein [Candidatus Bathyarchaeia archaeon]|nr:DUF424 family protein [Candidatus Bathyarchaeia archaeon]